MGELRAALGTEFLEEPPEGAFIAPFGSPDQSLALLVHHD
jgi:hypothetical protein